MDLSQALRSAAGRLRAAGVPSPEVDARLMAAHLVGVGPMDVLTYTVPGPFVAAFTQHFEAMVARREAREPLQHILGVAPFGPLELEVGPGVFIPRPETEVLADWAVRQLAGAAHPTVVDLCTGSGALALYIAHYVPRARVIAVELSDAALTYTRRNCAGSRVEVVHGDATEPELLRELDGQVDVLVSNPPYVPETQDLDPEVYQDPHMAVFGGADGMTVIDRMVGNIGRLVAPGGSVGIEHDDATSELTQRALRRVDGLTDVAPLADLTGTARFVVARMGDLPPRSFTDGQAG